MVNLNIVVIFLKNFVVVVLLNCTYLFLFFIYFFIYLFIYAFWYE